MLLSTRKYRPFRLRLLHYVDVGHTQLELFLFQRRLTWTFGLPTSTGRFRLVSGETLEVCSSVFAINDHQHKRWSFFSQPCLRLPESTISNLFQKELNGKKSALLFCWYWLLSLEKKAEENTEVDTTYPKSYTTDIFSRLSANQRRRIELEVNGHKSLPQLFNCLSVLFSTDCIPTTCMLRQKSSTFLHLSSSSMHTN